MNVLKENRVLTRNTPTFAYRAYEDLYISMREGPWKLLGYRSGRVDLFNVIEDRVEQNNLAERQPEKIQELIKQLKAWEIKMGVEKYSGFQ